MEPHLKAKEIVYSFYRAIGNVTFKSAKKCGLIHVDGIIQNLNVLFYGMEYFSHFEYWMKVKNEIQKL